MLVTGVSRSQAIWFPCSGSVSDSGDHHISEAGINRRLTFRAERFAERWSAPISGPKAAKSTVHLSWWSDHWSYKSEPRCL